MSREDALRARIRSELDFIEGEVELLETLVDIRDERRWDRIEVHAAASALHSVYTGIERALMLGLKLHEKTLPAGAGWHRQVLEFSRASGLIDQNLSESLQEYLGFRHMYRNSYGSMLDQDLIEPMARRVTSVAADVRASLESAIRAE